MQTLPDLLSQQSFLERSSTGNSYFDFQRTNNTNILQGLSKNQPVTRRIGLKKKALTERVYDILRY